MGKQNNKLLINLKNLNKTTKNINILKTKDDEQRKALNAWAQNSNFNGSLIAGTGFGKSRCGVLAINKMLTSSSVDNKRGLVLWGETSPQQFGYNKNINMISETPHTVDINVNNILENFKQLI